MQTHSEFDPQHYLSLMDKKGQDKSQDKFKTKAHFSIGELTKEFGITARALRFYEEKDLISPQRIGLERIYSRRDRGQLQLILLGKQVGFSLEDIRAMLDLYNLGDGGKKQLIVASTRFREQVQRLVEQRTALDNAIKLLNYGAEEAERRLNSGV